jgi:hypothetical protein
MDGAGRYRCAKNVHTRVFDGELVVLDLESGEYFALDLIGTALWTGLELGKTVEEIADKVVEEYDVARERALTDLATLCDELVTRRLLVHERG